MSSEHSLRYMTNPIAVAYNFYCHGICQCNIGPRNREFHRVRVDDEKIYSEEPETHCRDVKRKEII